MSALTDRITAVLEQHRPYGLDCKCGEAINSDAWWAAHTAEQVTAALQFTEETKPIIDPYWHDWCERILGYERRWVSGWTAVDPANAPANATTT